MINVGNIASTLENIKGMAARSSSPIAPPISSLHSSALVAHGTGDVATASYVKSAVQGSNTYFVWGVHQWGSSIYNVSP